MSQNLPGFPWAAPPPPPDCLTGWSPPLHRWAAWLPPWPPAPPPAWTLPGAPLYDLVPNLREHLIQGSDETLLPVLHSAFLVQQGLDGFRNCLGLAGTPHLPILPPTGVLSPGAMVHAGGPSEMFLRHPHPYVGVGARTD